MTVDTDLESIVAGVLARPGKTPKARKAKVVAPFIGCPMAAVTEPVVSDVVAAMRALKNTGVAGFIVRGAWRGRRFVITELGARAAEISEATQRAGAQLLPRYRSERGLGCI